MKSAVKNRLLKFPHLFPIVKRAHLFGRYALRIPHENDFRAFARFPGDGLFIDVGANSGASALSFHLYKPQCPILSIEPWVGHAIDLRLVQLLVGNMRVIFAAAGNKLGLLELYVPYLNSVPLTEFASAIEEETSATSWNVGGLIQATGLAASDLEIRRERVPLIQVDDLRLDPSFVKIDVQGYEPAVLEGMTQTVQQHHPVILVELSGNQEVFEWAKRMGYGVYHFHDGVFVPTSNLALQNVFLIPEGTDVPALSTGMRGNSGLA
jgi:FkbM family methyltransferase